MAVKFDRFFSCSEQKDQVMARYLNPDLDRIKGASDGGNIVAAWLTGKHSLLLICNLYPEILVKGSKVEIT